jgi:hypothetical protein
MVTNPRITRVNKRVFTQSAVVRGLASTAYEERFLAWGSKLLGGEPLQNYEIDLERIYNIADVERRGVDDAGTR